MVLHSVTIHGHIDLHLEAMDIQVLHVREEMSQ
jgi:hypothetical protein